MNVGRLFREGERRQAAALITKTAAPRPWTAMLEAWAALLGALCSFLPAPDADQGRRLMALAQRVLGDSAAAREDPLHLRTWRCMWSLPPSSEARKAAFTLGHAAMMIQRWRGTLDIGQALAGQHAESLLRMSAWHVDDAKQERRAAGAKPTMPAHIRVYAHLQPVDPEHGGVNFCGVMTDSDRRRVTLAMLDDFVRHASERKTLKPSDGALIALAPALVETLGASLPEGPWIVTSQDVWRFLAELLEEGFATVGALPDLDARAANYGSSIDEIVRRPTLAQEPVTCPCGTPGCPTGPECFSGFDQ